MNTVNPKIIDAVIDKAKKLCPDSLALIGVYGSVARGDDYEKSDLDLLILIKDDAGYQLSAGFILEDRGVGYDIYCTSMDRLRYDAECHHAQLSKLMDSKIVYIADQEAYEELCRLREQARIFLKSEDRFGRVKELTDKAKAAYADALLRENLGEVRMAAYGVIYHLLDAVMLCSGSYFKLGVKKTFEELDRLEFSKEIPEEFAETIRRIAASKEKEELRSMLKCLLLCAEEYVQQEKIKEKPCESNLTGTYEEMFSNWRNKVEEAAACGDVFSSYVNMCGLQSMLSEIAGEVEIGDYPVMEAYDPEKLTENENYDSFLQKYEEIYRRSGIDVKRYKDVDEFVRNYLENSTAGQKSPGVTVHCDLVKLLRALNVRYFV